MFKKKIGQISEKEKDEILMLFQRGVAINELIAQLNNMDFDKMIKMDINHIEKDNLLRSLDYDRIENEKLCNNWWNERGKRYNWESREDGQWTIDFETKEVFLY